MLQKGVAGKMRLLRGEEGAGVGGGVADAVAASGAGRWD